jgi:ABC-type branched-subunit amino acid transport system substrate-binding protein
MAVAAGCADDDEAGDEATTTTDGADEATTTTGGELTATARGVTADTITIAYAYLDFGLLVEQGLASSGFGDQELAFQTMVDAVNADGGINGRQVEVVYRAYSPLGTEDAEAACLELTQDNEVFAVLGGFLGPAEPANTCIAGQQETILVGGVQSDERLAEATAPWVTDRAPRSAQADILLSLLESEDRLEGASVALVTNTDAQDSHDAIVAAMTEHGVDPVEDLALDAPIGDFPAEDGAWVALGVRIRTSGADTVLVAGNPSSTIRNVASLGLEVEIWALDQESLLNLGTSVTPEAASGVLSAAPPGDLLELDSFAECRDTFLEANPDVTIIPTNDLAETDEDVLSGLSLACNFLGIFVAVASAAGPDLTNDSFAAAIDGLDDFSIATQPFASFGPDKRFSNDSFRLVSFNPDLGPTGGLEPLTDVVDVNP